MGLATELDHTGIAKKKKRKKRKSPNNTRNSPEKRKKKHKVVVLGSLPPGFRVYKRVNKGANRGLGMAEELTAVD